MSSPHCVSLIYTVYTGYTQLSTPDLKKVACRLFESFLKKLLQIFRKCDIFNFHITAGVYLYAEDFPYNFADLEQKFLCGGLNRLRYGCLLFLTCFSGKERGPSVSCLEASALFHFIGLFCRFRFGRRLFSCSADFAILCVEAPAQYWYTLDERPLGFVESV